MKIREFNNLHCATVTYILEIKNVIAYVGGSFVLILDIVVTVIAIILLFRMIKNIL